VALWPPPHLSTRVHVIGDKVRYQELLLKHGHTYSFSPMTNSIALLTCWLSVTQVLNF
jgi:hypothetical protein